jgi:hypothetical protein
MPELPPSDYANMSTADLQSAIQDLNFLINKEAEGCQIPAILGRNPYLKQLRENLKAAEAELGSRTGELPAPATDPDIAPGFPTSGGPSWSRSGVVAAVGVAGVLVLGVIGAAVFNVPINIRGSGISATSGTNPNVATQLPGASDVCGLTKPDYLNSVIVPLPGYPFNVGNPTKETNFSRCEYVVGTVGSDAYIDLIFTYSLYDASKPLDTSKLQPVPNLGNDAFFTGPNQYFNYTLTSHKSKLVFKVYLSKKESADDALNQEKTITKSVFDEMADIAKYRDLVGPK